MASSSATQAPFELTAEELRERWRHKKSGSGCLTDSPLSPIRFAIAATLVGRRGRRIKAQ